ncbi:MAG TPA: DUF475 domain-containing protein [Sphingomonadaceae bacterium]|nr:DUF475 domain-containing protein [Sphingomonadaceae bacterium]
MFQFYRFSFVFTFICLVLGAWYGWVSSGTIAGTAQVLWIIVVLSILEISLSFDNAVVNASVLKEMDEVWQRRFLLWGIAFAVFGMRIVFPLAIVAIAAGLGPVDTVRLSLTDPQEYERIVSSANVGIAGFGGAFLAMVGLKFFFDADKEVHWIHVVESKLAAVSAVKAIEIGVLLLILWGISSLLQTADALTFLIAGILGIVTFITVEAINTALEIHEERRKLAGAAMRSGLGGFLYLNVLDASFSFDGVIGAFALSNNMVVIALGLSIGAIFVRSMTIHLVRRGTLAEYAYLEHGAFWAIIALGVIMLFGAVAHVPEVITGLIGAVLIGLSLWWSIRHNRAAPANPGGQPGD